MNLNINLVFECFLQIQRVWSTMLTTSTKNPIPCVAPRARQAGGRSGGRAARDEQGDRAAATLVSPGCGSYGPALSVAGVPPGLIYSQEGVSGEASVSCFPCVTQDKALNSCRSPGSTNCEPICSVSAQSADPETFRGISAHLPIVDAIDK